MSIFAGATPYRAVWLASYSEPSELVSVGWVREDRAGWHGWRWFNNSRPIPETSWSKAHWFECPAPAGRKHDEDD